MEKAIAYYEGVYLAMIKQNGMDIWEVIHTFVYRSEADEWKNNNTFLITWPIN